MVSFSVIDEVKRDLQLPQQLGEQTHLQANRTGQDGPDALESDSCVGPKITLQQSWPDQLQLKQT